MLALFTAFSECCCSEAATKGVLRNFTEKQLSQSFNFIKKETLAQVFPCEFCKIPKNTFFTEHLWTTGSGCLSMLLLKRRGKIERDPFHSTLKQEGVCHEYGPVMSVFLPLHYFYLQKSYCK